jgi:hypothetical protein
VRILIDPGHGGESLGTTKGRFPEKDINLKLALILYENLKGNFEVFLTRYKDIYLSLKDRLKIVDKIKPEILLSLHHNANEEETPFYSEIYTSWTTVSPSYDLAYEIIGELLRRFPNREFRVLPSKFMVLKGKAKIKLLTELFFAEEMDENLIIKEAEILKNAIFEISKKTFAKDRDIYRSLGKYSQPRGYLTTNFGKVIKNHKRGDWAVVLGDGRLFWDAVEIINRVGGRIYHFGMSVQPSQFHTAMKISRTNYKKIIFLRYGEPYVRFYHTSAESGKFAEDLARALNYPLGFSSSFICIHPDGIRLELISKGLDEKVADILARL